MGASPSSSMPDPTAAQCYAYINSVIGLPDDQVALAKEMLKGKSDEEKLAIVFTDGGMFDLWCMTVDCELEEAKVYMENLCTSDPEFKALYDRSITMFDY